MADALLSPAVGGTFWLVTGGVFTYSSKRVQHEIDSRKIPLMGVIGAFIFAAQMINFTIPGTGSSGHIGGGMILAILLGPYAGFLTLASILTIQSLFFADGGLLALGGNIFNLGFFPCFIAYPLVYKRITNKRTSPKSITAASILSVILALQFGALFVVLQTVFSGVTELPFKSFILVMQPIHLIIGLIEGLVTAAVVNFIFKAEPEILQVADPLQQNDSKRSFGKVILLFACIALFAGGGLSWFASQNPDGLEWSIAKITGKKELPPPEQGIHSSLAKLQEKTTLWPNYHFNEPGIYDNAQTPKASPLSALKTGTLLSGIIGAGLTLLSIIGIVLLLRMSKPITS